MRCRAWQYGPECSSARTARRCDRQMRADECSGSRGAGGREAPASGTSNPANVPGRRLRDLPCGAVTGARARRPGGACRTAFMAFPAAGGAGARRGAAGSDRRGRTPGAPGRAAARRPAQRGALEDVEKVLIRQLEHVVSCGLCAPACPVGWAGGGRTLGYGRGAVAGDRPGAAAAAGCCGAVGCAAGCAGWCPSADGVSGGDGAAGL